MMLAKMGYCTEVIVLVTVRNCTLSVSGFSSIVSSDNEVIALLLLGNSCVVANDSESAFDMSFL